ncbi:MAG: hypothetical protein R3C68_16960 [Myxococcota bacterium]
MKARGVLKRVIIFDGINTSHGSAENLGSFIVNTHILQAAGTFIQSVSINNEGGRFSNDGNGTANGVAITDCAAADGEEWSPFAMFSGRRRSIVFATTSQSRSLEGVNQHRRQWRTERT